MLVKLFFKAVSILVVIFAFVAIGGIVYMTRGLSSGAKVKINTINLSVISDGTYDGNYKAGRWTNEVNVKVKNHKITNIDVVKGVRFGRPEWTKEIFDKVIQKQNTNVDIVSGATVTSKAYLKSIENALEK
jgi:uncharacterized protein with FMN-binding domain